MYHVQAAFVCGQTIKPREIYLHRKQYVTLKAMIDSDWLKIIPFIITHCNEVK